MAQEIYHRSNWGIASNEWGSTYLNADLTNELYKRAEYYENSWATDKILNKIGTKPSIILTPTAYGNGVLSSVKPAQVIGEELVTNGDFATDSDWNLGAGWSIANGAAEFNGTTAAISQNIGLITNRKYQITFTVNINQGGIAPFLGGSIKLNTITTSGTYTVQSASGVNPLLYFQPYNFNAQNFQGSIDNVSVKEVIDADFTFTRGSSATRVNEKGLIQDVQILSDELVQNGDFEQVGSELVTNGSFDTDSDWNNEGTASFSIANGVLNCFSDGSYAGISQNIVLEQGKTYKLELDIVRIGENSGSLNLGDQIGYILLAIIDADDNLGKKTIYFTPQITTTKIRIYRSSACDIDLDNVSVKEVGQNWDFGTGWSIEDGKAYYDGVENFKSLGQNNVIELNKKYRLNLDVSGLTSDIVVDVLSGNDFANPRYLTLSNGNVSFEFTATNALNNRFAIQAAQGDEVYLDNISVIEITDDTNLPRIDYTNGEGSLLLEPQSTNLVPYSEDFRSNSNFTTNAPSSMFESGYLAPDGTLTATRINGFDGYYLALNSMGAGDARSIYVKSGNGQTGNVNLLDFNSKVNSLFEVTSEWKRVELVGIDNWFYIVDGRGINLTLDDVIIWGLQQEELPYATSYIPTNGTTVTRAAETCNGAGNSDLINSTEGVIYAEISALADDLTFRVLSVSDGSNNNTVKFGYRSDINRIYAEIRSGGSSQVFLSYDVTDITDFNKVALKYKANDFALWVNGTERATDTSGIVSVGLDTLNFDNGGGSNDFYGNVKSVAVFKEALSDEELEKLTTL